jgi:hypothetical protein
MGNVHMERTFLLLERLRAPSCPEELDERLCRRGGGEQANESPGISDVVAGLDEGKQQSDAQDPQQKQTRYPNRQIHSFLSLLTGMFVPH